MPESEQQHEVISVDTFRVKSLLRDPAFYAALGSVLSALEPRVGVWVQANWILLTPLLIVLTGHFVVRVTGARELGRLASSSPEEVVLRMPDDPEGLE